MNGKLIITQTLDCICNEGYIDSSNQTSLNLIKCDLYSPAKYIDYGKIVILAKDDSTILGLKIEYLAIIIGAAVFLGFSCCCWYIWRRRKGKKERRCNRV